MIKGLDKWLTTPPEEENELLECSDCGELFEELDDFGMCVNCAENWEKEKRSIEETYDSLFVSMR